MTPREREREREREERERVSKNIIDVSISCVDRLIVKSCTVIL
jgi:hypothetical protein